MKNKYKAKKIIVKNKYEYRKPPAGRSWKKIFKCRKQWMKPGVGVVDMSFPGGAAYAPSEPIANLNIFAKSYGDLFGQIDIFLDTGDITAYPGDFFEFIDDCNLNFSDARLCALPTYEKQVIFNPYTINRMIGLKKEGKIRRWSPTPAQQCIMWNTDRINRMEITDDDIDKLMKKVSRYAPIKKEDFLGVYRYGDDEGPKDLNRTGGIIFRFRNADVRFWEYHSDRISECIFCFYQEKGKEPAEMRHRFGIYGDNPRCDIFGSSRIIYSY